MTLPGSTCLLNSFHPSSHPWDFYNLHVPSGVTLQGVTGSKLLQGPGGRQSISNVPGATWIENTVIAVRNNYAVNTFQSGANGGFYSLHAMTVASPLSLFSRRLRPPTLKPATTSRSTSTPPATCCPPR